MTKSKALGLSSLVWGFGPGLIADELSNGRLAVYKEDPGECPMVLTRDQDGVLGKKLFTKPVRAFATA
ncbi:unnamed protein product [Fusarium graminearum]|uniref:Chromosome 4, complete genome n=2 Tax=Gibberella zeae TaxID=5518 RepID=A0A098DTQ5_GIBZE|nr:unnamed protein product [Fusarium graminearum]CZS73281.1 unnamed protein product [Fusarium graminearum]